MSSPAAGPSLSPLRWWVCGLLLLATTLNYMDRLALNQTSVEVMASVGIEKKKDWGKIESAFAIAFALGTLSVGWLVDRVGVYWVYPVLVVGWSCAGYLTSYATDFASLVLFRTLLGFFEAGNWPCGIRTTRQVLSPEERPLGNSLFHSGTALGAIITPFIVLIVSWQLPEDPERWRWTFRVIGVVGVAWVALWFALVPQSLLRPGPVVVAGGPPFWTILLQRRFWVLAVVVTGVNSGWHTFRVWLPPYLRELRGYTSDELQYFSIAYYLTADVGSWTLGLAILFLSRRGRPVHRLRLTGFAACVGLVLSGLAIPFVGDGRVLVGVLLLFAFGALALFTVYFSMSQELPAAHQGKIIGTLGCVNAGYLAVKYYVEGWAYDSLGRPEPLLAVAGVPALIAFVVVLIFWNRPPKSSLDAPATDVLR